MPGIAPRNKVLPLSQLYEAVKESKGELRLKDQVLKVKTSAAWFGRAASRRAHRAGAIAYVASSVKVELAAIGEGLDAKVTRSLQVDLLDYVRGDKPISCRHVVELHELVQSAKDLHARNANLINFGEALLRVIGKWDPSDHVKLADASSLGFRASQHLVSQLRRDTRNVQPLRLNASPEERGWWLDQAKRLAAPNDDQPDAPHLALRAALLKLPLVVRASMLLALATRLAAPEAADRRVVEQLYALLASAFEPHELLPASERSRMESFLREAGELLESGARDWPGANDDERRRVLLSLSRHLGDQWPVPRAPLKLDAGMADRPFALEGSSGLFLSAHAGQGWGEFGTVLGHLITAWTLRSQPELARRVGAGELDERDVGLQALARIMAAQIRAPFTQQEDGSPAQMHASAMADLASTLLIKTEDSVETEGE